MELFNKNHITIARAENKKIPPKEFKSLVLLYGEDSIYNIKRNRFSTSINVGYSYYGERKKNPSAPVRYRLRESEFGFYYSEPVEKMGRVVSTASTEERSGITWEFRLPKYTYTITYLTSYNQTSIGIETRPWELVDSPMKEHFIFDLLDEVTKICDEAKEHKLKCYERKMNYVRCPDRYLYEASEAKRVMFTDLFGYPDGPKFQTNDEKILAHGFDLKTSFRKSKEE